MASDDTFARHREKYPCHYPVYVHMGNLRKGDLKVILPLDWTQAQVLYYVRQRCSGLQPSHALYLMSERGTMYRANQTVRHMSHDFINKPICMHARREETFG